MKRRVGCLFISFVLLVSSVSCGKTKGLSQESVPGCVEAAEEILDSLISCDSKSLKLLGGFDESHAETVELISQKPEIRKAIKKTYYEIDEESVIEKKSKASVDVDVKVPDYSSIVSELEIAPERFYSIFYDAVDKQSTREYKTVVLEMIFKIEDEEYILTNADEIVIKFYSPVSDAMQEYLDRVPADYGKREDGLFTFSNLKKVDLSVDRFMNVLNKTDSVAADKASDGNLDETAPYTLYKSALSEHVLYVYVEFATIEECKENAETLSSTAQTEGPFYHYENDWGCSLWQFEELSMLIYYSDKAQIMLTSTDGSEEGEKLINDFIEELTGSGSVSGSSQTSVNISTQDFKTKMSNEGYIVFNSKELRDNVIEQIYAGNSDSSIIVSYEVYKDKESASKAFEDWNRSLAAGKSSGKVDELILDTNKTQTKFDETYTVLILYEDVIITAICQPYSDENIALANKAITSLGL